MSPKQGQDHYRPQSDNALDEMCYLSYDLASRTPFAIRVRQHKSHRPV